MGCVELAITIAFVFRLPNEKNFEVEVCDRKELVEALLSCSVEEQIRN